MTVFLCVLGGLVLLLCIPASVGVSLDGEREICFGWLGFHRMLGEKEKTAEGKAKLEKKKAKKAATKAKKAKEKGGVKTPKSLGELIETLGLIMDFVSTAKGDVMRILKNLRVSDFDLKITVAKYDAAETAIEYGKTSAYVFGAFAALQNYIKMKDTVIDIKPDFLVDEGKFSLRFCVWYTPLVVLVAVIRILFGVLWAFMKRELAKQSDKTPQENPKKATK